MDCQAERQMSNITSFRDLIVWQKAMDLADMIYDVTERFPPSERFGLASQMRKAAVSVPSNIAEGSRRRTPGYIHHVEIALGSHAELDTQCELATRRKFLKAADQEQLASLLGDVGRLAHGLLRSLDPTPNPSA